VKTDLFHNLCKIYATKDTLSYNKYSTWGTIMISASAAWDKTYAKISFGAFLSKCMFLKASLPQAWPENVTV